MRPGAEDGHVRERVVERHARHLVGLEGIAGAGVALLDGLGEPVLADVLVEMDVRLATVAVGDIAVAAARMAWGRSAILDRCLEVVATDPIDLQRNVVRLCLRVCRRTLLVRGGEAVAPNLFKTAGAGRTADVLYPHAHLICAWIPGRGHSRPLDAPPFLIAAGVGLRLTVRVDN